MTISDAQNVTIGDQLPRSNVFEQNAKSRTSLEPSQQACPALPRPARIRRTGSKRVPPGLHRTGSMSSAPLAWM